MIRLSNWKTTGAVFLLCASMAIASPGQTFETLASFDGANGGAIPLSIVQGVNRDFYGTTYDRGANNFGTVFRITPGGKLATLYSFCPQDNCSDGATPDAGLVLATDANFYGTTQRGGTGGGTVFKITAGGVLTTLYSFCQLANCADGSIPSAAMVQGIDGNFYGTTFTGGDKGYGTIFKVTPGGTLTTLHSFNFADGAAPGELIQATDGDFYGAANQGGSNNVCPNGCGTVFKITPKGELTTLHNFDLTDGWSPSGGLVQATHGSFYGVTTAGGGGGADLCSGGCGTVFKITSAGALTTLHTFMGPDGTNPVGGLIQGTDGDLYGTTYSGGDLTCNNGSGCGTIFMMTPGGTLQLLHAFEFTDGDTPAARLVQATSGTFYGTTSQGGGGLSGTVFSLSVGLGPFVSLMHNPAKVGQLFGVLGQGLIGTTSVFLDGVPASFSVVSDSLVKATVPTGAATGYVTVTTPSGTLTSNMAFHVIK